MPVWHERTKALREAGSLTLIGITQEQHAERTRLFAQWHGIAWPILWDPFGTTRSKVVPRFVLIDELGVVRSVRASMDEVTALLAEPLKSASATKGDPGTQLAPPGGVDAPSYLKPVSALLANPKADASEAIKALLVASSEDAHVQFMRGVALRMRYDSDSRRKGDFARAVEAWAAALEHDPGQYIWRRRIQQWGPRLDKPYPFYDWVARAREAIAARGEDPLELRVPLSQSERLGRRDKPGVGRPSANPDAARALPSANAMVVIERTVVPATSPKAPHVCLHITLRAKGDLTFDAGAGPSTFWQEGVAWRAVPTESTKALLRFEIELPVAQAKKPASVFFHGCADNSGVCAFWRIDLD